MNSRSDWDILCQPWMSILIICCLAFMFLFNAIVLGVYIYTHIYTWYYILIYIYVIFSLCTLHTLHWPAKTTENAGHLRLANDQCWMIWGSSFFRNPPKAWLIPLKIWWFKTKHMVGDCNLHVLRKKTWGLSMTISIVPWIWGKIVSLRIGICIFWKPEEWPCAVKKPGFDPNDDVSQGVSSEQWNT